MALVERLMGIETKIPVHTFFAANHQRIDGPITRQDIIDYFVLDASATTEYDALAALAPTGTTALAIAQKAMFIEKVHAVFILAEERVPGYSTPTEVRARLGL